MFKQNLSEAAGIVTAGSSVQEVLGEARFSEGELTRPGTLARQAGLCLLNFKDGVLGFTSTWKGQAFKVLRLG